jgi:hypothetical protein
MSYGCVSCGNHNGDVMLYCESGLVVADESH